MLGDQPMVNFPWIMVRVDTSEDFKYVISTVSIIDLTDRLDAFAHDEQQSYKIVLESGLPMYLYFLSTVAQHEVTCCICIQGMTTGDTKER